MYFYDISSPKIQLPLSTPKSIFYYELVQEMDWPDLQNFWQQIRRKKTGPTWPPGKALEYLIMRGFELEGAKVVYPFEVHKQSEVIEQIDGLIFWENFVALVECKDVKSAINFDPIAKLRNRLLNRPSQVIGCFFSMAGYTEPAKILAEHLAPQTILLWEQYDIDFSLKNRYFCRGLEKKYQECVMSGRPDFNLIELLTDE